MEPTTKREFERLYRRHHDEICGFLARELGDRHEAEDVTQDTFLNAFRAYARGNTPEQPRPWLYSIAQNVRHRRHRRRRFVEVPLSVVPERAAPVSQVDAEELVQALQKLPTAQRKALLLREVAGLSYGELAQRLGLTEASVQMLLFRARRALRTTLQPRGTFVLVPWHRIVQWFQAAEGPAGGIAARAAATAAVAVAVAIGTAGGEAPPRADAALERSTPPSALPTAFPGLDTLLPGTRAAGSAGVGVASAPRTAVNPGPARGRPLIPDGPGEIAGGGPGALEPVSGPSAAPSAPGAPPAPEAPAPAAAPATPALPPAPALPAAPALPPPPALPAAPVPVPEPVAPVPLPTPPALPPSPLPQVPLPAPPVPPSTGLPALGG